MDSLSERIGKKILARFTCLPQNRMALDTIADIVDGECDAEIGGLSISKRPRMMRDCASCATDKPGGPNEAVLCRECVREIRAKYEQKIKRLQKWIAYIECAAKAAVECAAKAGGGEDDG